MSTTNSTEVEPTYQWHEGKKYQDIKYHKMGGIAKITINRPEVRNAFRPPNC